MRPLIHIGYHKTGTTWLQRHFFPSHPGLVVPFHRQTVVEKLVFPHPLIFDVDQTRDYMRPPVEAAIRRGKIPVISVERLSGNPQSGGYDSKEIADRIQAVFPEARIWIVIRNQVDIITSQYKHYVREGGTGAVQYYLRGDPPLRVPGFDFRHFQYDHLIRYYHKLFGKERVQVSLYEEFFHHPGKFLKEFCDVLGIEDLSGSLPVDDRQNAGFSDLSVLLMRPLNAFSHYPSAPQYPLVNLRIRKGVRGILKGADRMGLSFLLRHYIRNRVEKTVTGMYIESNRELEKIIHRDLSLHGYPT